MSQEVEQLFCVETLGNLVIDLSIQPHVPDGWVVESHNVMSGSLDLNTARVGLYLTKGQLRGGESGNRVRRSLEYDGQILLNANVLDALLKPENQSLIPASWRNTFVLFQGTVYRNAGGDRCVRSMHRIHRAGWVNDDHLIDLGFSYTTPTAVLVR